MLCITDKFPRSIWDSYMKLSLSDTAFYLVFNYILYFNYFFLNDCLSDTNCYVKYPYLEIFEQLNSVRFVVSVSHDVYVWSHIENMDELNINKNYHDFVLWNRKMQWCWCNYLEFNSSALDEVD